jgi:hypothetical protein
VVVPGCIGLLGGLVGTVVVVGTVTVTVLVPVVGGGVVAGLVVVTGASVTVVLGVVVVVVVVGDVVVAEADSITPQATRPPESPVDRVASSGPAGPPFC